MNKRILKLALPNIITNLTVPLLGMVDMAIVGHLSMEHLGAIAIGTQMFNLIYWNFGFLRMGTSGFTAQAYGADDMDEAVRIFLRALGIAGVMALLLIALQWPISRFSQHVFHGSPRVIALAMTYFFVRIWAAPATLGLYAVKGWFIGMQNSRLPMWIAIFLNIVNIVCSLVFVLVLHWDIRGVALGTVIAQYAGLAVGLFFLAKDYGTLFRRFFACWRTNRQHADAQAIRNMRYAELQALRRFFKVNGDIFLRTVCLAAVFTFITAASGRISDEVLAIDALLMQFFTLFSYFVDGFAYAGESLVGRYIGARDGVSLRQSVRLMVGWGMVLTLLFTALYALCGEGFLSLFSNETVVIRGARQYLFWTLVIPICGFSAFLFDGIFIGATASRTMRNSMFVATAAFFAFYYGCRTWLFADATPPYSHVQQQHLNNLLWTAFMVYLLLRGVLQAMKLQKDVYDKAACPAILPYC